MKKKEFEPIWPVEDSSNERVQCGRCSEYYDCHPDNPEDLCECPYCKIVDGRTNK